MERPVQAKASELALMELITIFLDASDSDSETRESSRKFFRGRLMELYNTFANNILFDQRDADVVTVLGEAVSLIGELLEFTAEFAKGRNGEHLSAGEILKYISLEMQS